MRPVYVGTDPLTGTFRRNNEGDYRCDQMTVTQMFANLTPAHPWTALSDLELMKKLGGYRKDRETGKEGFTMAGSGVDKIMQGWKDANWRRPYIEETGKPDKVELFLPMESLISDEVVAELKSVFGEKIESLSHNVLTTLAFAVENDEFSNGMLQIVLELHPTDITKLLRQLCKDGYLISSGFGKGTTYHLNHDYQLPINMGSLDVGSPDDGLSQVGSSLQKNAEDDTKHKRWRLKIGRSKSLIQRILKT